MTEICRGCIYAGKDRICNACRVDFYRVKSTDCCEKYEDCIEETDDNWRKIMKNTIVIILILVGVNSLFSDFILQREVLKITDNIWISWGIGFIHLCPIFNFIFFTIKK